MAANDVVIRFHERTKHFYARMAASSGELDWALRPDPFRRYDGAECVKLPLFTDQRGLAYGELYSADAVAPVALSLASIALFFRYALSLSAWERSHGAAWALRVNPSSGNLHPTEGYAVLPALIGLHDQPAVYHYAPKEHGLERRCDLDPEVWAALRVTFPDVSFLAGLSSIPWRESWRYGERAFRYCEQDVGHALATLRLSAAALGWRLTILAAASDREVAHLLGLDRDDDYGAVEREHPDLLALVSPARISRSPGSSRFLPIELSGAMGSWHGQANALSPPHDEAWPAIVEVTTATEQHGRSVPAEDFSPFPRAIDLFGGAALPDGVSAATAILGRRSALHMDQAVSITSDTFFRMLARLVPTSDRRAAPWDSISWKPRIHLGIFVHHVIGLTPGLYVLVRDPDKLAELRSVMHHDFVWEPVPGAPARLDLYLLAPRDCRALAALVSCAEPLAGDGAFSLAMFADFIGGIVAYGPAFYRCLYWEAGMIGQVLYLEAEEAGVRATGLGSYFDDPVREVFGVTSREWQSFYHLAVGGPIEDARYTRSAPYGASPRAPTRQADDLASLRRWEDEGGRTAPI